MSPATRRRSARLAHTAPKGEKIATAAPDSYPTIASVTKIQSPVRKAAMTCDEGAATPRATPATPASSVLKPPSTEMHPSKFQQSSFAPSSALELGFSDIKDPRRRDSTHGSGLDSTPSRIGGVSASAFSFRVKPPNWNWETNSKAQEVMAGLKGDVAKFKAELVAAQQEAGQSSNQPAGERAFARPRSKTGRFSAAHLAEFKKMGSIEGHASAWRAQNGKFTPVKTLKEGNSKTNLDVSPTPHKSNSKRIPTKLPAPEAAPSEASRFGLKRKHSVAQIGGGQTPKRTESTNSGKSQASPSKESVPASAKRLKLLPGDDASTARPESQDDDNTTPRPPSTVKRLRSIVRPGFSQRQSPVKAPTAQIKPVAAPTTAASITPRKPPADSTTVLFDAAAMTNATENMTLEPSVPGTQQRIPSPSRFQKAKSILRGQRPGLEEQKSGILQAATAKDQLTSSPRVDKASLPLTTPHQKAAKKVSFTPDTARVPMDSKSPSPQKLGFVGKAKAMLGLENKRLAGPSSNGTNAGSEDIVYPDLSGHLTGLKDVIEPGPKEKTKEDEGKKKSTPTTFTPPAPGTFSFRSDRTIRFGGASPSASGFGAAPGQSSIRSVRESIKPPSEMPGGFPASLSPTSNSNKENTIPSPPRVLTGALHGMSHKKRRRVSADSDMADVDDERAAKKRRPQAEGTTPARNLGTTPIQRTEADRPLGRTPAAKTPGRFPGRTPARAQVRTPGPSTTTKTTATPAATTVKKRTTFDMNRLNELARPKQR